MRWIKEKGVQHEEKGSDFSELQPLDTGLRKRNVLATRAGNFQRF